MPHYKHLSTGDRIILSWMLICGTVVGVGGSVVFYLVYTLFFMG